MQLMFIIIDNKSALIN